MSDQIRVGGVTMIPIDGPPPRLAEGRPPPEESVTWLDVMAYAQRFPGQWFRITEASTTDNAVAVQVAKINRQINDYAATIRNHEMYLCYRPEAHDE
jgi:hypothetical protein